MIKSFYAFLFFAFLTTSCATTEQVSEQASESQEAQERVSEDRGPDWYDHANRSFSDSTAFFGAGFAVASDSLAAYEESLNQARGYLNYSIDAYAEEVRSNLSEDANGDQFGSRTFILSLRNAVKNLEFSEGDLEIEIEHIEKEEFIHHVYTQVRISKDLAIEKVTAAIDNETFTRSLQDRYSR